jgi:hypothetical protein
MPTCIPFHGETMYIFDIFADNVAEYREFMRYQDNVIDNILRNIKTHQSGIPGTGATTA